MEEVSDEVFWKNKIKQYFKIFAICIIAVIVCVIGALLVLVWFIETTPLPGVGDGIPPNTFDDWTLNYVVGFIILIILWELLLVGAPAALFFGVGGYLWWKKLPDEEKQVFKDREKRGKKYKHPKNAGSSGGFSIFMYIAYCIVIAIDGNYNTRFGQLDYSYFIYAWCFTFMWLLIIFGIPVVIILLLYCYFKVWRKKSE